MWTFAGVPRAGASNDSGLSTTAIFGHLGGYFFGNFRDMHGQCYYMARCRCNLLPACKL